MNVGRVFLWAECYFKHYQVPKGDNLITLLHICQSINCIARITSSQHLMSHPSRHYDVTDLNQLFKTVSSKRILDFVKDIGLYNSL